MIQDVGREVYLPGLREDQPGTGTVSCDRQRLGRSRPAGDDPVREVRGASAAQSASRTLRLSPPHLTDPSQQRTVVDWIKYLPREQLCGPDDPSSRQQRLWSGPPGISKRFGVPLAQSGRSSRMHRTCGAINPNGWSQSTGMAGREIARRAQRACLTTIRTTHSRRIQAVAMVEDIARLRSFAGSDRQSCRSDRCVGESA